MSSEFQRLAGRSAPQAELERLLQKPPTRRNLSDFDRLLEKKFRGHVNTQAVGAAYRALWTRGPTGRAARRVAARLIVRTAFKAHPATRLLSWGLDAYNYVSVDKHARPGGFEETSTLNYPSGTSVSFGTALGSKYSSLGHFVGLSPVPSGSGARAIHKHILLWAPIPGNLYGRGTWIAAYSRPGTGPLYWLPPVRYHGPRVVDAQPQPAWWPSESDLPLALPQSSPARASWRFRKLRRRIAQENDPTQANQPNPSVHQGDAQRSEHRPSEMVQPSPADDVGFSFPPVGPPSLFDPPHHEFQPPGAGEREKKMKAKGRAGIALKWAMKATDANDLLGALYDAIPAYYRDVHDAARPKGTSVSSWEAYGVWKHLGAINGPEAMRNILFMEAEDAAVAFTSQLVEGPIGDQNEGLLRGIQKQQAMTEDVFWWTNPEEAEKLPSSVRVF